MRSYTNTASAAASVQPCRYFTPSILQLAGFATKRGALLAALMPAGVNALGSLVALACVDRFGRRRASPNLVSSVGFLRRPHRHFWVRRNGSSSGCAGQ